MKMKNTNNFKCINEYGEFLFFLTEKDNEILRYNLKTGVFNYIAKIQRGDSYYCTSCCVNDKIFYFSYLGNEYCIYDIKNNNILYQNLIVNSQSRIIGGCSTCVQYGKYIYILCGGKHIPMIKINTETLEVTNTSDWIYKAIEEYNIDIMETVYSNPCIANNILWITLNVDDIVLKYFLDTGEYEFIELEKWGIRYYTINCVDNCLWLTGDKKFIVKWDIKTNIIQKLEILPSDMKYRKEIGNTVSKGLFYAGYVKGKYIYYAPIEGDMFIRLNSETQDIKVIKKIEETEFCFYFFDLNDEGLWAKVETERIGSLSNKLYIIKDLECNQQEMEYLDVSFENVANNFAGPFLVNEKYSGMLDWFIKCIDAKYRR